MSMNKSMNSLIAMIRTPVIKNAGIIRIANKMLSPGNKLKSSPKIAKRGITDKHNTIYPKNLIMPEIIVKASYFFNLLFPFQIPINRMIMITMAMIRIMPLYLPPKSGR